MFGIMPQQNQQSGQQQAPMGGGIMSNPFIHLGLGILAGGKGAYGSFGQQLGQGAMTGILSYQRQQEAQRRQQIYEIQLASQRQAAKQAALRQQQIQQATANLSPQQQAMARAFPKQFAAAQFKDGTSLQQNYAAAKAQGFPGSIMDYQMMLKKAGATNIHMPTEGEKASGSKLVRISQAAEEIGRLEQGGMDILSLWDSAVTDYAPTVVQGLMRTDVGNRIVNAQNTWIQTFGRDESGAAIPDSEWSTWRHDYFPQVGNDAYTVQAKGRARKAVEEGMSIKAGRAKGSAEKAQSGIGLDTGSPPPRTTGQKAADMTRMAADGWETLPNGVRFRVKQ